MKLDSAALQDMDVIKADILQLEAYLQEAQRLSTETSPSTTTTAAMDVGSAATEKISTSTSTSLSSPRRRPDSLHQVNVHESAPNKGRTAAHAAKKERPVTAEARLAQETTTWTFHMPELNTDHTTMMMKCPGKKIQ